MICDFLFKCWHSDRKCDDATGPLVRAPAKIFVWRSRTFSAEYTTTYPISTWLPLLTKN